MSSSCIVDPQRLAGFREAMETYEIESESGIDLQTNEWAITCISPFAIAYSCGAIGRPGDAFVHNHEPAELELCARLSSEAVQFMDGIEIVLVSAGSDYFSPFFVAANHGDVVPETITEPLIRALFGGTINPAASIKIEMMGEDTEWWRQMLDSCMLDDQDDEVFYAESVDILNRWTELLKWFHTQDELHGRAFVDIGELSEDPANTGVAWPRLAVGITRAGSIVGICGCVIR